jgi:hypothetical protein
MQGFVLLSQHQAAIRFHLYWEEAPLTAAAFACALPLSRMFYHAKFSGQEIWIDNLPPLDIIQENASVFTEPGEVVLGPAKPARVKTANCLGIYYGQGRGLDACNIFARVAEEDRQRLFELGEQVWKGGAQELRFELMP